MRKIVVGVDFSGGSDAATRQAMQLARCWKAELFFLHVIDERRVESLAMLTRRGGRELTRDASAQAAEQLRTWLRQHPDARRSRPRLVIGRPAEALANEVLEREATTLVLGASGRGGARVPGRVAARCLSILPSDVLLVQRGHGHVFRRVVVCSDLGSNAAHIAHRAAAMVADGGQLLILHVEDAPPHEPFGDPVAVAGSGGDDAPRRPSYELDHLERVLARARPKIEVRGLRDCGWNYRTRVVEHLANCAADLVVVGHHRRSLVGQWLLGSTAVWLLPRAPCSLLAVRIPPTGKSAEDASLADVTD
jgi:nucleotide-binding universal stress UspA family protein